MEDSKLDRRVKLLAGKVQPEAEELTGRNDDVSFAREGKQEDLSAGEGAQERPHVAKVEQEGHSAEEGEQEGASAKKGKQKGFSATEREQRGRSDSVENSGSGADLERDGETFIISIEGDTVEKDGTTPSSAGKAETPPDVFSIPAVSPSFSSGAPGAPLGSTLYASRGAAGGDTKLLGDVGVGSELPADAGVDDGGRIQAYIASANSLPSDMFAGPYPVFSTAPYTSPAAGRCHPKQRGREMVDTIGAGVRTGEEGGSLKKILFSLFPSLQENKLQSSPPLSTREVGDDVIEFVVEGPLSRSTPVPYLFVKEKAFLFPSAENKSPQLRTILNMEKNVFQPGEDASRAGGYHQRRQPYEQNQQLQELTQKLYVSDPAGAYVVLRGPQIENGRGGQLSSSSGGKQAFAHPFVFSSAHPLYGTAASAPLRLPSAALSHPQYSIISVQGAEKGAKTSSPRFIQTTRNLPVATPWRIQEQISPSWHPVPLSPRSERGMPTLFPDNIARNTTLEGDTVLVPNAKRLLCFGHAGDEIKLCFGLLQLPPPSVKYDFLLKKKAFCFGWCERVDYVAVCRKCRMRLPSCPYCHKQSAIRHP